MNNIKGEHLICQGSKEETRSTRVSFVDSLTQIESSILFRFVMLSKRFKRSTTSHQDIADHVGCRRETVVRVLRKLSSHGIVYIIKRGKRDKVEKHKDKTHIYVLPKEIWGDMELAKLIKYRVNSSEYLPESLPGVEYCDKKTDQELVSEVEFLEERDEKPEGETYQNSWFKDKCSLYKSWGIEILTFNFNGKIHEEYLGPNKLTKKIQEAKKKIKNGVVRKLALARGFKNDVTQENIRGLNTTVFNPSIRDSKRGLPERELLNVHPITEKWKRWFKFTRQATLKLNTFPESVIVQIGSVVSGERSAKYQDPFKYIITSLLKEAAQQHVKPNWSAYYYTLEKEGLEDTKVHYEKPSSNFATSKLKPDVVNTNVADSVEDETSDATPKVDKFDENFYNMRIKAIEEQIEALHEEQPPGWEQRSEELQSKLVKTKKEMKQKQEQQPKPTAMDNILSGMFSG